MNKKTAIQILANEKVNAILNERAYIRYSRTVASHKLNRLNKCQAWTYEVSYFVVLISYNTEVACIDMRTGICYDYLRKVFGYTASSAQHIAKFMKKIWCNKESDIPPDLIGRRVGKAKLTTRGELL